MNLDSDRAGDVLDAASRNCPRIITFSQRDPSATVYGHQVRKAGRPLLGQVLVKDIF